MLHRHRFLWRERRRKGREVRVVEEGGRFGRKGEGEEGRETWKKEMKEERVVEEMGKKNVRSENRKSHWVGILLLYLRH
jgi:hypothetical protein